MRKAFTLIELLVVIAIIVVMMGVAVVTIMGGQEAARLKGSARDVFATVRLARLTALASEQPCVVTFETEPTEDGCQSRVLIHAPEMQKPCMGLHVTTLKGKPTTLGEEEPDDEPQTSSNNSREAFHVRNRDATQKSASSAGNGQDARSPSDSSKKVKFTQVEEEVLKDICIKVVMDSDEQPDYGRDVDEVKRSSISIFSNVDFLLGDFREQRAAERKEKGIEPVAEKTLKSGKPDPSDIREDRSLAWQPNGRCEPHKIYVYAYGADPKDGWVIRVDRFGTAKILENGEDD